MWRGGLGAAYLFPPLSSGGASIASPCPVSTSRSSNRTCGFPASGSPTAVAFRHTPPVLFKRLHLKAKLVPGSPGLSLEGIGLRHSPDLWSFPSVSEVRPLSSAGITRHHRYYEPVRHPIRPGRSLTGCRLVSPHHRWGFPCCVGSPCIRAVAITPAGPYYEPVRHPIRPGRSLTGCRLVSPHHRWGFPCWVYALLSSSPTTAAFPEIQAGRLPHYPFRGLLSVHSRYGLHTRQVALRPSTPEASEMSLPTSPLRLLPTGATLVGWDSHPLKIRAFHGALNNSG